MRPPSRPPPSFTRVCGAAAASRQGKMAVLHEAALYGHACCVESLLKAGANASLKNEVSGGAEGRGGKRLGSGRGTERVWGRGLVQASRRLSAPPCPRPLPSSPGCLYPPPSPLPPLPVAVAPDGFGPRQAGKPHGDRQAPGERPRHRTGLSLTELTRENRFAAPCPRAPPRKNLARARAHFYYLVFIIYLLSYLLTLRAAYTLVVGTPQLPLRPDTHGPYLLVRLRV